MVREELLSQMVDDIIRERTLHPNYFANEKELRSSDSVHDNFLYRRDEAITMCFRRIFGVGLDFLDREGKDIVTSRLEAFKASGEIEKMLTFRLRDLKLLP